MDALMNWWDFHEIREFGNRLAMAAAIWFAFWVAARVVHAVIRRLHTHMDENADLLDLLGRVARVGLNV